ncbi:hypothetical protein BDR03DRAFT_584713 [Suillus americanus]|nr:hypothetical protein BDR03DRAFT_584713 [Suillus americanus]
MHPGPTGALEAKTRESMHLLNLLYLSIYSPPKHCPFCTESRRTTLVLQSLRSHAPQPCLRVSIMLVSLYIGSLNSCSSFPAALYLPREVLLLQIYLNSVSVEFVVHRLTVLANSIYDSLLSAFDVHSFLTRDPAAVQGLSELVRSPSHLPV